MKGERASICLPMFIRKSIDDREYQKADSETTYEFLKWRMANTSSPIFGVGQAEITFHASTAP
jgi:hypothetical protein